MLEKQILEWCIKNRLTLSLAESCTGGEVSAQLVGITGASDYFLGSFVAYSNLMKEQMLGVSKEFLNSKGAVSEDVVREMVEGVF